MFALAGVLLCISLVATFHYFGTLPENLAVAVAAQVALLFIGAWVLQRSVRVAEAIEQQLQRMATAFPTEAAPLQPLAESDPAARGWNAVIEQLKTRRTLSTLETRFSELQVGSDDQKWNRIFHAMHDGIAACDRDENILLVNNAFLALLGLRSTGDAVGRNMFAVLREHLHGATVIPEHAMQNTAPFTVDLLKGKVNADGVVRVCRNTIIDESHEKSGQLWTLRDVTQQKIAQEMRDQFLSTATHELRTPLSSIKAYAETLALSEDISVRDQKDFCNIINSEATRLSRFVDELLNVNQMESGAVTLVRDEVELERMLNEVIDNLKPQLAAKELQFESCFPGKLPDVTVDKDKMVAALVNLLGNAIKYTSPQGTVRFLVEVDEATIHFHIEDTGIGISADELPRITEKFFRSSDARVQTIVGSGLGLAYSQEVARLHGGKIAIKSELNKGSRFTLSLPLPQGDGRHVLR